MGACWPPPSRAWPCPGWPRDAAAPPGPYGGLIQTSNIKRIADPPSMKEKECISRLHPSSYPLLNIFWTIVEIFLWVIWFWILITIFIDIFRSPDLSGWAKALWFLFVLFIPIIGVLVYLITRAGSMHQRSVW